MVPSLSRIVHALKPDRHGCGVMRILKCRLAIRSDDFLDTDCPRRTTHTAPPKISTLAKKKAAPPAAEPKVTKAQALRER